MSIGDKSRRAREEMGLDPRPLSEIRAEEADVEAELEALTETPPEVEPVAPMGEQGALAAAIMQALKSVQPAQGITKDDLSDVMRENSEGMRRALKPENARHPDVSVFNKLGERDHPREPLKRKTFWAGVEEHREDLDSEEIALYNSFAHTKEARNGTWRAEIRRQSNGVEELHIAFPCATADDRMDLPSKKLMLVELLGGKQAVDPLSLAHRVAELEKQLAAK